MKTKEEIIDILKKSLSELLSQEAVEKLADRILRDDNIGKFPHEIRPYESYHPIENYGKTVVSFDTLAEHVVAFKRFLAVERLVRIQKQLGGPGPWGIGKYGNGDYLAANSEPLAVSVSKYKYTFLPTFVSEDAAKLAIEIMGDQLFDTLHLQPRK